MHFQFHCTLFGDHFISVVGHVSDAWVWKIGRGEGGSVTTVCDVTESNYSFKHLRQQTSYFYTSFSRVRGFRRWLQRLHVIEGMDGLKDFSNYLADFLAGTSGRPSLAAYSTVAARAALSAVLLVHAMLLCSVYRL